MVTREFSIAYAINCKITGEKGWEARARWENVDLLSLKEFALLVWECLVERRPHRINFMTPEESQAIGIKGSTTKIDREKQLTRERN